MSPKLSIGMPVYNGAKYLREALDALLAQTFADFELIISDNASNDATEAICRAYASVDDRVRYVRQQGNVGPIKNFQFVVDKAFGEYFMWAAADDVWDVEWIETLLPTSAKHQCLSYGFVQSIDASGNKISHPANCRKFEFTGNRLFRRCKYFMSPGFMGKANLIYGVVPLSYLKETGILWLESEGYGGDMIFMYNLLKRTEIRHANGVFHYKRIHDDCASGGIPHKQKESNILKRSYVFVEGLIFGTLLGKYVKRSSAIQTTFLLVAYPVCVAHAAVYQCFTRCASFFSSHSCKVKY